jgi:hypothetical protein
MVRPEGLLPFRVERDAAAGKFRQWLSGLWFRPNDLSEKSALSELVGVYVPFWTFDAATHSAWTAEAGYDYQESVQVEENRRWVTRSETRTRWEHAEGLHEHAFDDVPVPASKGLPPGLSGGVTGHVGGKAPWSIAKIGCAVIAVLLLLLLIAALKH